MLMKIKRYVHIPSITCEWDAKWTIMKKKALWTYFMHTLWMRFEWNLKCVCVPYTYHMNEMPRNVWLWKVTALCAHCMNDVSCIVWMEC